MTEREIIIDWLVNRPDDEAHPEFTRCAMVGTEYTDEVHKQVLKLHTEFATLVAFAKVNSLAGKNTLRRYYEGLTPESLVESFDGWCCHQYR